MIVRGSVKGVRELSGRAGPRVQAEVVLGASSKHGVAVTRVELKSDRVLQKLAELKEVIAEEALEITRNVLNDHLTWDREKAAAESATGVVGGVA